MEKNLVNIFLQFQKNEITEFFIYKKLAEKCQGKNKEIFENIARDEKNHYEKLKKITQKDVKENKIKVLFYFFLIKIFGLMFTVRLMEKGENKAINSYKDALNKSDAIELNKIIKEEAEHYHHLITMLYDEKVIYLDSMVLAVNNALQELCGVIVGFSFALKDSKMIGVSGLITGIAATISMAASEYLSQKTEDKENKDPLKASIYSGLVYLFIVLSIVSPFFVFKNYINALLVSGLIMFVFIFIFSYFVSVVKERKFLKIFIEILVICIGVVIISFFIGSLIRKIFIR